MTGRSVLITGCSAGGIGYALAEQFQKQGLIVFATARSLSKMAGLETLPNTVLLPLDVTSPSEVLSVVENVKARTGGKLDYLVNNSGHLYEQRCERLNHPQDTPEVDLEHGFGLVDVMFQGRHVRDSVYNASKASIHSLGETLRMELKPLDVKVPTVVTGTIQTNISANAPKTGLATTSLYLPVGGYMDKMHQGQAHPNKMKASVYAEQVVGDVLSGLTGKTWRGANAAAARYLPPLLPTFLEDMILTQGTSLDQVGH